MRGEGWEAGEKKNLFSLFEREFVLLFSVFFALVGIGVLILASGANGKESARKFIDDCQSGKYATTPLFLEGSVSSMQGCSIVCNAHECTYLGESETFVVRHGVVTSRTALKEMD